MAQQTGDYITYQSNARKQENLTGLMNLLANMDTPCYTAFSKTNTDNILLQWKHNELAAAAKNALVEGFDVADSMFKYNQATNEVNYTQLFGKATKVSGSQNNVARMKLPGETTAVSGQVSMLMKELTRDIEITISGAVNNAAGVVGTASVARELKDVWALTSTSIAGSTQTTDGTRNTTGITESTVNKAAEELYKSGGLTYRMGNTMVKNANMIVMSTANKVAFDEKLDAKGSNFRSQKPITGWHQGQNFTSYSSSFGEFSIVPSAFCAAANALVFNPSNWSIAVKQPVEAEELAKTGHNVKMLITTELTLMHINPKASAKIILS